MMDLLNRIRSWTLAKPARAAVIIFLLTMLFSCLFRLIFHAEEFLDSIWRDILIALPVAILVGIIAYLKTKRLARK